MNGSTLADLSPGGTTSLLFDLPGEDSLYYKLEGILVMFYLVHPKRTMCASMDDVPNFYIIGTFWAPLAMVMEFIMLRVKKLPGYHINDSLAGLCAMIAAAIPQVFFELAVFSLCSWIHANYRLIDVPYDSWFTWFICIFAADLSFYVAHRIMHEVNLSWASHQLHHSSEYFNLFSSARNSFLDKLTFGILTIPWSFLLPVGPLRAHHQLNFTYQFWVHTKAVGDLGLLEYILVTPTQHAIHHGRNRFCIDMNYGGFLSIWDHLFNTMVWPREHTNKQIYYGLTHPVASWDVVYLYGHSYRDIFKRVGEYENFTDKMSVLFKGPGWEPGKPRLGCLEDIPEEPEDKDPYDKTSPVHIYIYCAVSLAFAYYFNGAFIIQYQTLPWYLLLIGLVFSTWTVADIGYILEHKSFVPYLEWARCIAFFAVDWLFASSVLSSFGVALIALKIWFALAILFWTFNIDYFSSAEFAESGKGANKAKVN